MSSTTFRFQQFAVEQTDSLHKVGTDGVLLGAWAKAENAASILDVGTGTGLVALMAAQRTGNTCVITGIDTDAQAALLAEKNFRQSPWTERLKVFHCRLQNFNPGTGAFDHILSNPPYFENSLLPPDPNRQQQRHTDGLTFRELVEHCFRLLAPHGTWSLILPEKESRQTEELARANGFFLHRETSVHPKTDRPAHRRLLAFGKSPSILDADKLILMNDDGSRHPQYEELMKTFYLNKG